MKWSWVLVAWSLLANVSVCASQTGKELYEAACASCHGRDGRGAPEGTAIKVPLPDFTDCSIVSTEPTGNWMALTARGGPALGLSSQMPSFADSLSEQQIREAIAYLRGFCSDSSWPSGDLNFRRSLVTGKAFPEDEIVLNVSFEKSRESRSLVNELTFEKRLGSRGMAEVTLPIVYSDPRGGAATGGVGDLTLAYRAVGGKFPVAGAQTFDYQVGAFLLWEYFDGGLWW